MPPSGTRRDGNGNACPKLPSPLPLPVVVHRVTRLISGSCAHNEEHTPRRHSRQTSEQKRCLTNGDWHESQADRTPLLALRAWMDTHSHASPLRERGNPCANYPKPRASRTRQETHEAAPPNTPAQVTRFATLALAGRVHGSPCRPQSRRRARSRSRPRSKSSACRPRRCLGG